MSLRRSTLPILVLLCALLAACGKDQGPPQSQNAADSTAIPTKVVKFANLPYGDHTYSAIGVARGWFSEVGIDLRPETIKIEEVVPSLENGTFDVVSVPPGILFSAYDTAPDLCTFVFGDLFQGYALMAQPGKGYKSYTDLRKGGLGHAEAVKAVVQQMAGKTFAYPTETAVKPFIDLALQNGGLTRKDIKSLVLDDPLTVNAMRTKQADFQVGGVPSRLALQKEGFVPILSSVDLANGAQPSADSKELASILQNGWAMKKAMYDSDRATALRMAAVNYRIMKFMKTNRDEALSAHLAYLAKVTGQKFTPEDGAVIYDYLDPFVTFEDQKPWFSDTNSPFYFQYINGAILRSFVADKVYKKTPPNVDDVIYADDTYRELERLKAAAEDLFKKVDAAHSQQPGVVQAANDARKFYDSYDYYDAQRLAEIAWRRTGGK